MLENKTCFSLAHVKYFLLFMLIINVLELKHNIRFLQPFMDAVLSIGMG